MGGLWKGIIFILIILVGDIIDMGTAVQRKNVLFLVSDDMRPELSVFTGSDFPSLVHPKLHTPNLDALASRSLVLKRAYVQQAVCSPSRTSLLTGRRPDTTHVYDLVQYFRKVGGNFTTIPQYFKENGYLSVGIGKIFHPGTASGGDDPISWSVPYYHAPNKVYWAGRNNSWLAVPASEYNKKPLPDTQLADRAIEVLKNYTKQRKPEGQPLFLAVGFHKPHLPFIFPEEMLQYYPNENIRLPENMMPPLYMPPVAWSSYGELLSYHDVHASGKINSTVPPDKILELRRAYYSALTYTDQQIGRVLQALEAVGLQKDTIVSFWGDHGWQLGEHGEWCKHTNFELATHAPMMISVPGITDNGVSTERLTEFVDLFPTLAEAAGLNPLPLCPTNSSNVKLCREGTSLMPLMKNPNATWKAQVFSQYPRDGYKVMGYSIRTDKYRYTEWVQFEGKPKYQPDWNNSHGVELYDHVHDAGENFNVASVPGYRDVVKELSQLLHKGWRNTPAPVEL